MLAGIGFGLTAFVSAPAGYALTIGIWTFGEIAMAPLTPAIVADKAPPDLRGSYQGALHLAFGAAMFAAPMAGSFVVGRFGAQALWLSCVVAGSAVAFGHLALAGKTRAGTAVTP